MTTEIANVIQMINNKVAKLADEGMNEQSAFDAIMKRMEREYPEAFALLINIATTADDYWQDQDGDFFISPRPGDHAAELAEEWGIDYSSALVFCNCD